MALCNVSPLPRYYSRQGAGIVKKYRTKAISHFGQEFFSAKWRNIKLKQENMVGWWGGMKFGWTFLEATMFP